MRTHALPAILLILLMLTSLGCKSDQERAAESLRSFAEAVVIHRAPYHAYALLDHDDKAHVSVEAWSTGFEDREPVFPLATTITIGDVTIKRDQADATVKITPPTGDPETRKYVLRREGTKWRIWLGLKLLDEIRTTLGDAQRLVDDGAIEQAREKVESVAERPFPASLPDAIDGEVSLLRQKLGNKERFVEFDGRFNAALKADLETMKKEAEDLATKIGVDDEAFYPRLVALLKEVAKLERQSAMDGFQFSDIKAKQTRDTWGLFREVRFKATNNTGRVLAKLGVRVELKNEGSETALGSAVWQLIEEGGKLGVNEAVDVKREFDKAPDDWKGREVALHVEELEFAPGSE